MEFNSQICTTEEQSKRLLALGLKKETADMLTVKWDDNHTEVFQPNCGFLNSLNLKCATHFRSWSLHRLIEMLNYQVIYNGVKHEPVIAIDGMAYQDVYDNNPVVGWSGDFYTDVIDCIEWLIKEEYFNEEYLEE